MPRKSEQTYLTEKEPLPTTLRMLMEERNIKQATLAEAIGVTRQTISLYVTGQSKPDSDSIAAIARFFNVTTDYLLGKDTQATHEATDIYDRTGLSLESQNILSGFVNNSTEGSANNHCTQILNALICDPAFWSFLDLIDYYIDCKANPIKDNAPEHKQKIIAIKNIVPELADIVNDPKRLISIRRTLILECVGQMVDRISENKEADNGNY